MTENSLFSCGYRPSLFILEEFISSLPRQMEALPVKENKYSDNFIFSYDLFKLCYATFFSFTRIVEANIVRGRNMGSHSLTSSHVNFDW